MTAACAKCAPTKQAALLDHLLQTYKLKNDAHLARELGMDPPSLSTIRRGRREIGASFLINVEQTFGMSIAEQRAVAGLSRYIASRSPGAGSTS